MKFKVGDYVVYVGGDKARAGKLHTVKSINAVFAFIENESDGVGLTAVGNLVPARWMTDSSVMKALRDEV